ncbi:hypothetical protein Q9R35_00880 [Alcaligenes sp. AB3]|uniref:hypothetical protein n=1 Tax=Alcaligenes sp. AB3 TaxID=2962569 RepID=UPI00288246A6|nr:hypothetical protein [Alcaligenes sp. AB3]MDT0215865.1 hypothetical protein [Alcaligenes sp. AB3]
MAVSKVAIANRALTKLGAARIIALDDDSQASNTLDSMFDTVRDAELRASLWHFSKARAVLPRLSEAPAFGYSSQFQLPADCLRLIQVGSRPAQRNPTLDGWYSIEGGRLLVDDPGPLRLRYVKRIEDPTLFDALFVEVLACRLAAESCETLTQSNTKKQAAWSEYEQALSVARRANAIERPALSMSDDTWLEARN